MCLIGFRCGFYDVGYLYLLFGLVVCVYMFASGGFCFRVLVQVMCMFLFVVLDV